MLLQRRGSKNGTQQGHVFREIGLQVQNLSSIFNSMSTQMGEPRSSFKELRQIHLKIIIKTFKGSPNENIIYLLIIHYKFANTSYTIFVV